VQPTQPSVLSWFHECFYEDVYARDHRKGGSVWELGHSKGYCAPAQTEIYSWRCHWQQRTSAGMTKYRKGPQMVAASSVN